MRCPSCGLEVTLCEGDKITHPLPMCLYFVSTPAAEILRELREDCEHESTGVVVDTDPPFTHCRKCGATYEGEG